MRYTLLGPSQLSVSAVALGTSSFGRWCAVDEARAIVNLALDEGITLIDTAAAYPGSELMLGQVLDGRRHEAALLTKYAHPSASQPHAAAGSRNVIRASIERSLTDLRTDYVDIFMMHWPDPATPIRETLEAAYELVDEGKVRYLGCSNFSAWRIVEAVWTARTLGMTPLIATEDLYSLVDAAPERDVIPVCLQYGLGELAYAPLHYGLLTGRYPRGGNVPPGSRLGQQPVPVSAELFDRVECLEAFGRARGLSLLQVAIGGLAAQPGLASVITGCSRREHVRANARAADWQPSAEDLLALSELRQGWA